MEVKGIRLLTKKEFDECIDKIPAMKWNPKVPLHRSYTAVEEEWWLMDAENGIYDVSEYGLIGCNAACAGVITGSRTIKGKSPHQKDAVYSYNPVRPVLVVDISNDPYWNVGDRFKARGFTWTIISDALALCDTCIGKCKFNELEKITPKTRFRVQKPSMKWFFGDKYNDLYHKLDRSMYSITPDYEDEKYWWFTHRTNVYKNSLVRKFVEDWFKAEPMVIEKIFKELQVPSFMAAAA